MQPDYVIQLAGQSKDLVDYFSALMTPMIMIVGVGLGILQWRINRMRLRHELFEKRWTIYETAKSHVKNVLMGKYPVARDAFNADNPAYWEYLETIDGAKFVYNKDVWNFLFKLVDETGPYYDMDKGPLSNHTKVMDEIDKKLGPFLRLS